MFEIVENIKENQLIAPKKKKRTRGTIRIPPVPRNDERPAGSMRCSDGKFILVWHWLCFICQ